MVATTGYQAGFESSQSQISYAVETVWANMPAVPFQAIRYMSESLSATKTRDRPAEITTLREAVQAITTRVEAGGDIKVAFSFGTFDDFMASALNSEWTGKLNFNGAAGDITINSDFTLTSITTGKFNQVVQGQYLRLVGFTNPANNGIWRVAVKTSNVLMTLSGPNTPITETPAGTAVKGRFSYVRNSSVFRSLFIQQAFASNVFITYAGCQVSGMNIAGGVGQFINGSFTVMAQQEADAVVDSSSGTVVDAPAGPVMDPVGSFHGVRINGLNIVGVLDSFSITTTFENAAHEYGMGSAAAAGVVVGTLRVSGMLKLYFASLTLYDTFKTETSQRVAILIGDALGNDYVISGGNVQMMNPKVEVTGPGSPVFVTYDLEFNPSSTGEGTIQLDRLVP